MAEENNQSKDLFRGLLQLFYDLLKPLLTALEDPLARNELLASLGLNSSNDSPQVSGATQSLEDYLSTESAEADPFALASALVDLTQIMLGIKGFIESVKAASDGDDERTASEIITAVLNLLTLDYIRRRAPAVHTTIQLLNVIDTQAIAQGGSVNFFKDVVFGYFKRVGKSLDSFQNEEDATNAADSLFLLFAGLLFGVDVLLKKFQVEDVEIRSDYGYEGFTSSQTPNADKITNRTLTYSVGFPITEDGQGTVFNTLVFVPKDHQGVAVVMDLTGKGKLDVPLGGGKALKFELEASGYFRIGEGAEADLTEGKNKFEIAFEHIFGSNNKWAILDKPIFKFGVKSYKLGFAVKPDDFEVKFFTELLVEFGRGELSGFPYDLLPEKIDEKIPIGIGYSIKRNLFVDGSGTIGANQEPSSGGETGNAALAAEAEAEPDIVAQIAAKLINAINFRIPIHKDIGGVIGFENLYLKTGVQGNFDQLSLETSLDFWLRFGSPLLLNVSRFGLNLNLNKRDDNGGLGGYDLVPKIKPPTGAGVRVDAGVVKGGGFLYFDDEKGEYYGSLELDFKELFTLKAIGLINTIMPDGSKGFSMVIIITAEFSPIQLGLGFTLNGVGGLLGLNRSVEVEALRLGLRTNAIKSILFPEDVIGNIQRIISDLKQIFPIAEDRFVIGLMGKFGWGPSGLISIELGLILELPDPKIILLGVIKAVLPTEETALVRIQVNFLGVLDFQNQFFYFEATLFDSHVVGFPLTGSMAFVVGWGDRALFAISIGGFHPDFTDYPTVPTLPGAFRNMDRLGIQLLADNPRLGIECYMAVTTNSVQFGAKAELLASGPAGFNLYGLLAFDALFIFDPFSFIISLEATLAIRRGTSILFGIHFYGKLSGPTPWHVEGEVSFSIFFFEVSIGFSATWGDPPSEIAAATEDLRALLGKEIADQRNWTVVVPTNNHQYITLRQLDETEAALLIIQPFGQLIFSQQALPLNYKIEKYGEAKPKDADQFSVTKVTIGDSGEEENQATAKVQELFAPGHFTKLSDSQKLSRKSFESLDSGFQLTDSGKIKTPAPHLSPYEVEYELDYTGDDQPANTQLTKIDKGGFKQLSRSAAVSQAAISWLRANNGSLNQPETVELPVAGYTLANTADLSAHLPNFTVGSQAEAFAKYNELVRNQPELATAIQVVETFELAS
ncbi:MAG: DUF6603 domain-containing protein [Saprospiraceae bacterium]